MIVSLYALNILHSVYGCNILRDLKSRKDWFVGNTQIFETRRVDVKGKVKFAGWAQIRLCVC